MEHDILDMLSIYIYMAYMAGYLKPDVFIQYPMYLSHINETRGIWTNPFFLKGFGCKGIYIYICRYVSTDR